MDDEPIKFDTERNLIDFLLGHQEAQSMAPNTLRKLQAFNREMGNGEKIKPESWEIFSTLIHRDPMWKLMEMKEKQALIRAIWTDPGFAKGSQLVRG